MGTSKCTLLLRVTVIYDRKLTTVAEQQTSMLSTSLSLCPNCHRSILPHDAVRQVHMVSAVVCGHRCTCQAQVDRPRQLRIAAVLVAIVRPLRRHLDRAAVFPAGTLCHCYSANCLCDS